MRVFISGANRGIGLEFVRQYLAGGERVFATCRNPDEADALQALCDQHPEQLSVGALDVTDDASIEAAYRTVATETDALDLLINNAGIQPREQLGSLDRATLQQTFNTNTTGPLLVAQRFTDLLRGGRRPLIANITSQLGSLARKRSGGRYSYNSSKAALNMVSKALAYDLRPAGITVVMVHPGWVQTDMGGSDAPLRPEEAVRGMVTLFERLTPEDTARYLQWDGSELPW